MGKEWKGVAFSAPDENDRKGKEGTECTSGSLRVIDVIFDVK